MLSLLTALCLRVMDLHQERKVFDQQEGMGRTHRTSQTPAFRAKTAPPWVLIHSKGTNEEQEQWSSSKQLHSTIGWLLPLTAAQNRQWKGVKGPKHQRNLTVPASGDSQSAWQEWSGDGGWLDFLYLGLPPENGKPLWTQSEKWKEEK